MTTTPREATRPRLLIEEWLPAKALGVECMRERGASSALPPLYFLHVWWARRPLVVSRAAVLASLLPAGFDRAGFGTADSYKAFFERLLGFYASSDVIALNASYLEAARRQEGNRIANPHGPRAFNHVVRYKDVEVTNEVISDLWGESSIVIDPMAGGGSIPFEASRLGLPTVANELNPVACSVLEATVDYPLRFGQVLADKAHAWSREWLRRFRATMDRYYESTGAYPAWSYIFARTVPCPDTGHPTPLVPDWHLMKKKGGKRVVAEPVVLDATKGTWTVRIREVGQYAGQLRQPPPPTYQRGKGFSLFTRSPISDDYIKATAQRGEMGSVLYAVVLKTPQGIDFRPAEKTDVDALEAAERELARLRPKWEREGVIPTEKRYKGDCDRSFAYGLTTWADMFAPRQLLAMGTLVEELRRLRPEIVKAEGAEIGEAVAHLLAFVIDKFDNYNCVLGSWHAPRTLIRSVFDRHDFSFKWTFAEMATCVAGSGLEWAIDNVLDAYEALAKLPRVENAQPVVVTQGSATHLVEVDDGSVAAVVVDPPYADNVQYAELADFFYVWLKRTQGHRRPEWFSTPLCDPSEEAVVNVSRFRASPKVPAKDAKERAYQRYDALMTEVFREARRVLRDDGVLTVMFTHKKQEAWASLFESLIEAGFTVTATWPVRTESEHSLHQAGKNAAQSTVILASRKRPDDAGLGLFNDAMREEIRGAARQAAAALAAQGLTGIDGLVGSFGKAMEVFSGYAEVRTDTGQRVGVAEAIETAADAVAEWRIEQLAARGIEGLDAESRFALLCWDTLQAPEFRFNEAMMLGRAVGMDVDALIGAGLLVKKGEQVRLLPASERRRERAVRRDTAEAQLMLFGLPKRGRARRARSVHPLDEVFASGIDACHAVALRYADAGGGDAGIGAVKGMARQQGWSRESPPARLMEALVRAAPASVRFGGKGEKVAETYPEFRAWHALLNPVFGMEPPEWKRPVNVQPSLHGMDDEADADESDGDEE